MMAKSQLDLDALATAYLNRSVATVERPFLVPILSIFFLELWNIVVVSF